MNKMNKEQEIAVLQSLVGDTYFNQFFGKQDIDRMCENIKNDFAIEMGCQFNQKAAIFQQQVKEEQKKQIEIKQNFVRGVISDFEGDIPMEVYDRLVEEAGLLFIINFKREWHYELTDNEIDWMIEELNNVRV